MIIEDHLKTQFDRILFHYDIIPKQIEQNGHVSKILSNRGTFALKETIFNHDQETWFLHVMDRLRELHIPHVPIYPSKYGDFFVHRRGKTYYLMPWVFEKEASRYDRTHEITRQLAILHQATTKEQEYSDKIVDESGEGLIKRWSRQQERFEQFAYQCEHKVYQSPFELEFLSHFKEIMTKIEEAKGLLTSWKMEIQETKALRSVLCHGKLSPTHIVIRDQQSALINFEKAVLDTPVRDLAIFLRRACFYLKINEDEWFKLLNTYESIFALNKTEKILLRSYLTYPEPFVKLINQYEDPANDLNEITYVARFEQHLLQFKQITHILDYLERERNDFELADSEKGIEEE